MNVNPGYDGTTFAFSMEVFLYEQSSQSNHVAEEVKASGYKLTNEDE